MDQLMIGGRLVAREAARLGIDDLGLLRGYAVFDYFRVVAGQPLFVDDYLRRFATSARLVSLELPVGPEALEGQVREVIAANALADAGIHLLLTGGQSPDGFTPGEPTLVVQPRRFTPGSSALYDEGARLVSLEHERELAEAKTTNYLAALRALPEQRAAGAVDVLFHARGRVSETARSNVFVVKDGRLKTPARGMLPGITRARVLELARGLCPVEEAEVALEEAYGADELFITSSMKGVMPIVALDGRRVGGGAPGELTRALMAAFAARVAAYVQGAGQGEAQRPVRT